MVPQMLFRTSNIKIAQQLREKLLNTYQYNQNETLIKIINVYGMYYISCYYQINQPYSLVNIQESKTEPQKQQIILNEVGEQFYEQIIFKLKNSKINNQATIQPPPNKIMPSFIGLIKQENIQLLKDTINNLYHNDHIYLYYIIKEMDNIYYVGIYSQHYEKPIAEQKYQNIIYQRIYNKDITKIPYEIFNKLCIHPEKLYNFDADCYSKLQYNEILYMKTVYQKILNEKQIEELPHYAVFIDTEFYSGQNLDTNAYELSFLIHDIQTKDDKLVKFYPKVYDVKKNMKQLQVIQKANQTDINDINQMVNEYLSHLDSFVLLVKGKPAEQKYLRQIGQQFLSQHIIEEDDFLSLYLNQKVKVEIQKGELHKYTERFRCKCHQNGGRHCSDQDVYTKMYVFEEEIKKKY